jgi:hypothetical protein
MWMRASRVADEIRRAGVEAARLTALVPTDRTD